jgi:hypothetical protein
VCELSVVVVPFCEISVGLGHGTDSNRPPAGKEQVNFQVGERCSVCAYGSYWKTVKVCVCVCVCVCLCVCV